MPIKGLNLINANSFQIPLAEQSVHMVACSPPYYGLRNYEIDGQLGMEETHDCLSWATGKEPCDYCFVCAMRKVAREIWRVLRNDGLFWLNLGDTYSGSGRGGGKKGDKQYTNVGSREIKHMSGQVPDGLKPKDLMGIPWRVAIALQADGWYVRRDIIWFKTNAMPNSAPDRPSSSHEYIFILSKFRRYFYDGEAIKSKSGSNAKSVWSMATARYSGAHFATWPKELVEKMILAGTSDGGCCPICQTPFVRIIEKKDDQDWGTREKIQQAQNGAHGETSLFKTGKTYKTKTLGFEPVCDCKTDKPPLPCIVLDPFAGSGTTGIVAKKHRRNFIGIDLSFNYLKNQARNRLGIAQFEKWQNSIMQSSD